MKTLIFMCLSMLLSFTALAQDKTVKTATIAVKGNCDECKKRIENAADIKGVKISDWDEVKQSITVTYRADKVSVEEIEKAIAASGHDTQNIKGKDASYNNLPACCKYRHEKCETKK